jgi:hypothetical protein
MDLNYAWKKLYSAVRSAIRSDKPVEQRLLECYLELHTLDYRQRLPRHLQPQFQEMIEAWARKARPTGKEWSVAAAVGSMEDEEAQKWLEEILKLYTGVVERKATAEAYLKRSAIRDDRRAADLARLRAKQEKAIDVFCEVYRLLEDFAPAWYPEELRERTKEALRILGRSSEGLDDPIRKAS